MATRTAKYSHEEFARLGVEIFNRSIGSSLHPEDDGKFIAIDVESGDFEMNRDDVTAIQGLRGRRPDAQIWMIRAGRPTTYRIGGRRVTEMAE